MSIRSYLFVLFIIFVSSSVSVALLWFYMNPVTNPMLSFILLGTGVFLIGISILIPFIYFFKKVYYRWDVNLSTMNASVRQGILLMIGLIFMAGLYLFHIHEIRFILAIWATLWCIEVMIQAVE